MDILHYTYSIKTRFGYNFPVFSSWIINDI